ncbi:MAG: right-handed parallel beta-helix repeat-containing protein [Armatimonadetes bacterium]|nr:right-handed parallel beta-helix repeat-containing protein [Armatimonadota bacterium]
MKPGGLSPLVIVLWIFTAGQAWEAQSIPVQPYRISPSASIPIGFKKSPQVEFYGNYETAGVLVSLPAGFSPGQVTQADCFLNIRGRWAKMHPLSRVGDTRTWAGSLFWLKPGSRYQVKAVLYGPKSRVLYEGFCSGMTRPEPVLPSPKRRLCVSTTGSDADPGTLARPLRTIRKALSLAMPGTTVFVRRGVHYEGDLRFPRSGQPGLPIVLRSFPGESAVLDGADPPLMAPGAWEEAGERLYTHPFAGRCYNMTLQNRKTGAVTRLLPLKTVEEVRRRRVDFPDGEFANRGIEGAFACDGTAVWAALPGPVEVYTVRIARATKGIILENRRHILVDGLEIRSFGKNDYSCGAFLSDASDIAFRNCRFRYCDTGVWVKGDSHRVTVEDCGFVDGVTDWSFDMLKTGACPASFETGAVYVDAKFSGRGLVVRRNTIRGLFDGSHLVPWTVDTARPNEIDFYRNRVLDCADDFIEVDGFARNVRVFENYMRRSLSGISIAQALDGPTFVLYNVLADCGLVPAVSREGYPGYPFKTNGGYGMETGSGPVFFYHNTAYTLDPDSRALLIKRARWKKITLRNNIWCGLKMGFDCWQNPLSPFDFDYDNLYTANPKAPLVLRAEKIRFDILRDVRLKLGYLCHGISADPRLYDPARGLYTLRPDSPSRDAGVPLPGINTGRWKERAPDMGAYEGR